MKLKKKILLFAAILCVPSVLVNLYLIQRTGNSWFEGNKFKYGVENKPNLESDKYSSCNIPFLNPFDESVSMYYQYQTYYNAMCHSKPSMTSVIYDSAKEKHILRIIPSAVSAYTSDKKFSCYVELVGNHFLGISFYFEKEWIVEDIYEFLIVTCYKFNTTKKHFYKNAHAIVSKKKVINEKPLRTRSLNELNILVIGIDSMSRLNLYRTMPETVSWLHAKQWVEFSKYHKIADNTFPNVMALLTGLPPERFPDPHLTDLDIQPYIWNEFSSRGYVTAYAEDEPWIETFYCYNEGFVKRPTDHFIRPFFKSKALSNGDCIGSKSLSEHLFSYMLDFVHVYKNNPFFGFFWTNEYCHSDPNRPTGLDSDFVAVLENLEASGALDTSMVIFISDHGYRTGSIRYTKQGWYEDRLPFLFMSLPKWFRNEYPDKYKNLLVNSKYLTTPFDLHLTMYKTLEYFTTAGGSGYEKNNTKGISLINSLVGSRSCGSAGVATHWCACHDIVNNKNKTDNTQLANYLIQAINKRLYMYHNICRELRLSSVLYVRKVMEPDRDVYVVAVRTQRGLSEVEGTVIRHQGQYFVEDVYSRVNPFDHSHCVENPLYKLFCECFI